MRRWSLVIVAFAVITASCGAEPPAAPAQPRAPINNPFTTTTEAARTWAEYEACLRNAEFVISCEAIKP